VLVTGGGGYVGSALTPKLLDAGFHVRVLDLFLYGRDVLDAVRDHPHLELVTGDLRDRDAVASAVRGCDAVIHLACISNDPSFELDPDLGKSINFDSFRPLVEQSRAAGVRRFIYASSSSVYGVKQEEQVTEDLPLEPLTDYSRFKALCEEILREYESPDFTTVTLRPATVCGYAPRLRLDLTVNILTNHAVNKGKITVFGGSQYRPNIHIDDITDLYVQLLQLPASDVTGRVWNAGWDNMSVAEIARQVQQVVGAEQVDISTEPTDDLRSYRISSAQILGDIGFAPQHSIHSAASDLHAAFQQNLIAAPLDDDRYYNVRRMQSVGLR
jgi:nucleoside-diphosphate-sugar epimerase